jgi:hypothetical protein
MPPSGRLRETTPHFLVKLVRNPLKKSQTISASSALVEQLGLRVEFDRMSRIVIGAATKTPSEIAAEYFGRFHLQCEGVFKQSLTEPNLTLIAASHRFAQEIGLWCEVIGDKREAELFRVAEHEYEYSLLALAQGHYRHAFKSLRLVLELTLQAVYLSANELRLREWFGNRVDTSWSAIVDEKDGVFSSRFAKGFMPSLKDHTAHYGGMAVLLYRECSEAVHGNMPQHIPLPSSIAFEQKTFDLWHSKAEILRLVLHFAIALRYFNDLSTAARWKVGGCLGHLSHVSEIKVALTAPKA